VTEDLLAAELVKLNRHIGDALRETPLIPVRERRPSEDAVVVRLANAADVPQAMERLKAQFAADQFVIGLASDGAIEVRIAPAYFQRLRDESVNASLEAIMRRIGNSGLSRVSAMKEGAGRILIEAEGFDGAALDGLVETLTPTGALTFNLIDAAANPADYQVGVARNNRVALPNDSMDGELQVIILDSIIRGADLASATQQLDQYGRAAIAFTLHPEGTQRLGRVTTANLQRQMAIVVDNRIVSAPMIQSPITGGSGLITGSFSLEEAKQLAIVLRSGALPVKLRVLERIAAG
jgi:protein-export membrane protein SecD